MANETVDDLVITLQEDGLDLFITRNGEVVANPNAVDTDTAPDTTHTIRAIVEEHEFKKDEGILKVIIAGGNNPILALNDVITLDELNYTVTSVKPVREGNIIVLYQVEAEY
ncbi:MAG: hypothetical protein K0U41_02010 [Gammaproteobacteria bacterium]|nr:hypothetical protein [Gammaproteobacteria bacterium]